MAERERVRTEQRERAMTFLRHALAEGSRPTSDLICEAGEQGIVRRRLYRARDELGVVTLFAGALRSRAGRLAGTYWRMPRPAPTFERIAQPGAVRSTAELRSTLVRLRRRPLPQPDLRWIV